MDQFVMKFQLQPSTTFLHMSKMYNVALTPHHHTTPHHLFGQGFSVDNLQRMRMFYIMYQKYATPSRISEGQISQTLSAQSPTDRKTQTVSRLSTSVLDCKT